MSFLELNFFNIINKKILYYYLLKSTPVNNNYIGNNALVIFANENVTLRNWKGSKSGHTKNLTNQFITPPDHPSKILLKAKQLDKQLYDKYLDNSVKERELLGPGKSNEMITLYHFWCYYLRKEFVSSMYKDFKKLALEDNKFGFRYGIECLFRYYSYGLESTFKPSLYREFEAEVMADYEKGQLYGLEKFWAFLKFYKHSSEIRVDPRLKVILSNYKTLEDFKYKEKKNARNEEEERK